MSESISMNRETALKNAIMRTTRFNNVNISETVQLLKNLTSSFYRVIISREDATSIIEILNKKIISVNATKKDEKYSIKNNSLIISGIDSESTISVEYYDDFQFLIEPKTHNETEIITTMENSYNYAQTVNIEDAKIKELHVENTKTKCLDCETIRMGRWEFNIKNEFTGVLSVIRRLTSLEE